MREEVVLSCEGALLQAAADDQHVLAVQDEAASDGGGGVAECIEGDLRDSWGPAGAKGSVGDEASLKFLIVGEPLDASFVVPQRLAAVVETETELGASRGVREDGVEEQFGVVTLRVLWMKREEKSIGGVGYVVPEVIHFDTNGEIQEDFGAVQFVRAVGELLDG